MKNDCVYAVNLTYDKLLHKGGINKKIKTNIDSMIETLHKFLANNFGDNFYLILQPLQVVIRLQLLNIYQLLE